MDEQPRIPTQITIFLLLQHLGRHELPIHDDMLEPETAHAGSGELVLFQRHIEVCEADITDLSLARIWPEGAK